MLEQLYRQYGEMMVKAEILQNQIQEVKRQIVGELNKKEKPDEQDNNAVSGDKN